MPYNSILVSLAGKLEEKKVVDEAAKLAQALGANLTFIHINDPGAGKMHMMMDSLKLVTKDDLRNLLMKFGFDFQKNKSTLLVLESEKYAKTVAEKTKEFDLLITGHHNKNSFLSALIDSTDEHISDMVDCPLLLISI